MFPSGKLLPKAADGKYKAAESIYKGVGYKFYTDIVVTGAYHSIGFIDSSRWSRGSPYPNHDIITYTRTS